MIRSTTLTLAVVALGACAPTSDRECADIAADLERQHHAKMVTNLGKLNGIDLQGTEFNSYTWIGEPIGGLFVRGVDPHAAVTDRGERVDLDIRPAKGGGAIVAIDGVNVCGDGTGRLVPGVWDLETGARTDTAVIGDVLVDHTFSCDAGVIAKCARWGYDPREVGAELHQTCTRMARADYCGDGTPHTEDGTLIDVYDTQGLLDPTPDVDLVFEAGWGPDGAVCGNRTRYAEVVAGSIRLPECWDALPECTDWESAQEMGATMGNSSALQLGGECTSVDEGPSAERAVACPGRGC